MVGLYIDARSDEQRDRGLEGNGWTWGFTDQEYPSVRGLVGHAEDYRLRNGFSCEVATDPATSVHKDETNYAGTPIYNIVPRLFRRFGKDRIVAACKARAAKGNAPTVTEIRAKVYRELVPAGGMSGIFTRDLP